MRELKATKKVVAVPFDAYTGSKTDAPLVDVRGFDSAQFVLIAGAVSTADGSNTFALSLTHGDEVGGGDQTAVPAGEFSGAAIVDATGDADSVIGAISYVGNKRYVRAVLTETGTASATLGVVGLLSHAHQEPV